MNFFFRGTQGFVRLETIEDMGENGAKHPFLTAEAIAHQGTRTAGPTADLDEGCPLIAFFCKLFKQLINFTEANASSFVLERPFLDRIPNMPPETVSMMQAASPVFYHDFQMNFQKVMFYGIELQLLIFDLLVFTALDKEFNSFAIAAFLTWLVGIFVDHLRGTFGETNISRKSLIDGRFLI